MSIAAGYEDDTVVEGADPGRATHDAQLYGEADD